MKCDQCHYLAYMRTAISIIIIILTAISCGAQHINGITSVATPQPFEGDPYKRIKKTNANWICLVPYGFSRKGQTELWYNVDRQWWGEKPEGVVENIKLAHKNGLKVFLKPQVYVPGSWPGDLDFKNEEEWQKWESAYRAFILTYVEIAIKYNVEMFCVGTEFKKSESARPQFWKSLINDIRCIYSGDLTYSSNWDSYDKIRFWDDLDYIGISSYFPLDDAKMPTASILDKSWNKYIKSLNKTSKNLKKKILFTEYGYLSVDGCAGKTWEIEKQVRDLPINEEAQAIAFNQLYENLWHQDFWAGGFIWKWFPEGMGHEGYVSRDYTPQDKKAENVLKKWFGSDL